MYRRKASPDLTEIRTLELNPLIDAIKNGQTNEFIAVEIMKGVNGGWDAVTNDLAEDFFTWCDTTLGDVDLNVTATAWSTFINYVAKTMYPIFINFKASSDDEANALGDEFISQLCDLLRGKSIQMTFALKITRASIQ